MSGPTAAACVAGLCVWLAGVLVVGRTPGCPGGRTGGSAGERADSASPGDLGGDGGRLAAWRPGRGWSISAAGERRGRSASAADELAAGLDRAARRVRGGDALSAALAEIRWPEGRGRDGPDVQVARHAAALAAAVGGQVAATLDAAAATLRARQAVRAEISAHSAQARLSVRVLTVVPLVVAALTALSTSGRAALGSAAGVVCLTLGATLNGAGWMWMRRLIRAAGR